MDRAFYDYIWQLVSGQGIEQQVDQPLLLIIMLGLASGLALLLAHYAGLNRQNGKH